MRHICREIGENGSASRRVRRRRSRPPRPSVRRWHPSRRRKPRLRLWVDKLPSPNHCESRDFLLGFENLPSIPSCIRKAEAPPAPLPCSRKSTTPKSERDVRVVISCWSSKISLSQPRALARNRTNSDSQTRNAGGPRERQQIPYRARQTPPTISGARPRARNRKECRAQSPHACSERLSIISASYASSSLFSLRRKPYEFFSFAARFPNGGERLINLQSL